MLVGSLPLHSSLTGDARGYRRDILPYVLQNYNGGDKSHFALTIYFCFIIKPIFAVL